MDGEGRSFEQSFIDTAIGQFYATPFSVEFGTDAADQAMAAWISENTGGTIDPQVKTESDLLLSIINAVYFKGGWMDTFDAANTAPAVFHAASGDVETQFMTQRIDSLQGFRQTDDFLRARLAFTGGTMMTFVLPAEACRWTTCLPMSSAWPRLLPLTRTRTSTAS